MPMSRLIAMKSFISSAVTFNGFPVTWVEYKFVSLTIMFTMSSEKNILKYCSGVLTVSLAGKSLSVISARCVNFLFAHLKFSGCLFITTGLCCNLFRSNRGLLDRVDLTCGDGDPVEDVFDWIEGDGTGCSKLRVIVKCRGCADCLFSLGVSGDGIGATGESGDASAINGDCIGALGVIGDGVGAIGVSGDDMGALGVNGD
jgi:hypothetical protein